MNRPIRPGAVIMPPASGSLPDTHDDRCISNAPLACSRLFESGASMLIATTTSPIPVRIAQPYAELKRRVEAAGLMKKRPGYYILMLATNAVLFGGTLWLLTLVHSVWATALVAAVLGVVSGQLGFQLHDSGHRQMFASRRLNAVIGIVTGNGLLGMSHGWWVDKHNRHHGNPNNIDLDPDID